MMMDEDGLTDVLEILGRSVMTRGVEGLAAWLISPRGSDGITPAEHLSAGDYNRARLLAVTTTAAESARRRAGGHT